MSVLDLLKNLSGVSDVETWWEDKDDPRSALLAALAVGSVLPGGFFGRNIVKKMLKGGADDESVFAPITPKSEGFLDRLAKRPGTDEVDLANPGRLTNEQLPGLADRSGTFAHQILPEDLQQGFGSYWMNPLERGTYYRKYPEGSENEFLSPDEALREFEQLSPDEFGELVNEPMDWASELDRIISDNAFLNETDYFGSGKIGFSSTFDDDRQRLIRELLENTSDDPVGIGGSDWVLDAPPWRDTGFDPHGLLFPDRYEEILDILRKRRHWR